MTHGNDLAVIHAARQAAVATDWAGQSGLM
jgi:hypothetical protein